jgi:hypothetical protein
MSHKWAPLGEVLAGNGTVLRSIKAEKALKALPRRCEFGLWEAPHLRRKPNVIKTSMKNAEALPNPPL